MGGLNTHYITAIFSIFFNMTKKKLKKKMYFVFYDKFSLNTNFVIFHIHDCMEIFHANGCRALNQYTALLPQTQFKNIFK